MKTSTEEKALTMRLVNGDEVTIRDGSYTVATSSSTATASTIDWNGYTTGTGTANGSITISTDGTSNPITPTVYPTPIYPTIYPTTSPHFPPTVTPVPLVVPLTFGEEREEYFQPPRCGKCRTDVSIIQSFIEKDVLIMIFTCHGEKRRVDISLKRFKGNEADAKAYLLEQIDWLFCEEEDWQKLTPKTVKTDNADRNAIREWLAA